MIGRSSHFILIIFAQLQSRGFKALKQSTKLLFLTLHRPSDALQTYTQLLTYTKSAVTRNYSEKTINGILDYVGGGKGGVVEVDVLEKFYQVTKDALEEAKNDVRSSYLPRYFLTQHTQRLSAKTNLKLAKLWLDRKEYGRLSRVCLLISTIIVQLDQAYSRPSSCYRFGR